MQLPLPPRVSAGATLAFLLRAHCLSPCPPAPSVAARAMATTQGVYSQADRKFRTHHAGATPVAPKPHRGPKAPHNHLICCCPCAVLIPSSVKASTVKEVYHYTTYALAAGVPLALLFGAPVSSLADLTMTVAIPLHAHIGMRSVIVDYIWDPSKQRAALMAMGALTVLSAATLARLNLVDEGLSAGVKSLWVKPAAPKEQ